MLNPKLCQGICILLHLSYTLILELASIKVTSHPSQGEGYKTSLFKCITVASASYWEHYVFFINMSFKLERNSKYTVRSEGCLQLYEFIPYWINMVTQVFMCTFALVFSRGLCVKTCVTLTDSPRLPLGGAVRFVVVCEWLTHPAFQLTCIHDTRWKRQAKK